jgi:hypothetical protein
VTSLRSGLVFGLKVSGLIAAIIVIGTVGVGTGCGVSGRRVVRDILDRQWRADRWESRVVEKCLMMGGMGEEWRKIMTPGTVIVVMQNNNELRAGGGVMGSFARIKMDERGLVEVRVEDIYQPDGQIVGHVEPPYPIQEAFGQGWWRLRDANWDVDFSLSAQTQKWFFEQGGEENIKGVVAVNLGLIQKILKIVGIVRVETYGEELAAETLGQMAQEYAQVKKDKRGFLGAASVALLERVKGGGVRMWIEVAKGVVEELNRGEVLMWWEDSELQRWVEKKGWGGRLEDGWDEKSDYLYIVESNLGSNKANCCVYREVNHSIRGEERRIDVKWRNENEESEPRPPQTWGGEYVNYVRMVVPGELDVQSVWVEGQEVRRADGWEFKNPNSVREGMFVVEERGRVQIIGWWMVVPAGSTKSAEVRLKGTMGEGVTVKRQPGMDKVRYRLQVDDTEMVNEELNTKVKVWK